MANPFLDADTAESKNPFLDAPPEKAPNPSDFTLGGFEKGVGKQMWEGAKDLGSLATLGLFDKKQATSPDPEEAFQQGYENSPGSKAMGASRVFPPIALGSELFNKVSPAIDAGAEAVGIDPKHVHTAELFTPLLGAKAGKMEIEPVTRTVRKATDIIAHPLDNAAKAVESANKFVKPAVQKIERARLDSDNPLIGGGLKTSMKSDVAKEGTRLENKIGMKFSAAEKSGNPSAMGIEDALANSAKYAGRFAAENEKKTTAVVDNFKKTLDTIHPQSVSRVDIGSKISDAYKNTIDALVGTRRSQGKVDFELADQVAGGHPIIAPTNFITTLKKFIAEGEGDISTPAQRAAAKQAKDVLKRLESPVPKPSGLLDETGQPLKHPSPKEAYKRITISDLQNGLAAFGEGAKSPNGGIWKGLSTAADRRFSGAAKAALEADMDASADSIGGAAAQALKLARDRYRANSNKISDVERTTLGKIVGSAEHDSVGNLMISPEKMADKFLSMEPTEIKNTLAFLDKNHPDVANMARRYSLEVTLHKALEGKGQRGEGASKPFPKAKFVESLPGDDRLDALLGSRGAAKDVKDVAAALNRMVDWGASRKGSATAQRTDVLETVRKYGAIKGAIYRSLASDALVEDLLDPSKRKELTEDADKINKTR